MPRTHARIRGGGGKGGGLNIADMMMPAKENVNFNREPGDIDPSFKGDPTAYSQQPYETPSGWMRFFNPSAAAGVTEANVGYKTNLALQAKQMADAIALARTQKELGLEFDPKIAGATETSRGLATRPFKDEDASRSVDEFIAKNRGIRMSNVPVYESDFRKSLNNKLRTEDLQSQTDQATLEGGLPMANRLADVIARMKYATAESGLGTAESEVARQNAFKKEAPVTNALEAEAARKAAMLKAMKSGAALSNAPLEQNVDRLKLENQSNMLSKYPWMSNPATAPFFLNPSNEETPFVRSPVGIMNQERVDQRDPAMLEEMKMKFILDLLKKNPTGGGGISAPSMSLKPLGGGYSIRE